MAYALKTHTGAALGQNGGTTTAIDTTGADLLVVLLSYYAGTSIASFVDSKGNTWIPLTVQNGTFRSGQLYYCKAPTVGTGHTITASGASTYTAVCFAAFSGSDQTAPFDVRNGSINGANAGSGPGSITP